MNRLRQRGGTAAERLERLLAVQDLLARVSRRIGPALDLQEVLEAVLDAMRSLVAFRGGSVCLVDGRGVYVAVAHPAVTEDVQAARVPPGQGLVGACIATGEPVYSADIHTDPRVDQELRRLGSNAPIHSYLAVPLVCLGESIGCVQVDSEEVDAFDADDLRVLQGLAVQVAGAIESARRYEQTYDLERLKTDFIARASHELRTPLTISSGFVNTLLQQYDSLDDVQRRSFLEKIANANARLWYLVEELLTVTMLEAGATEPRLEAVRLPDLCQEVASLSRRPEAVTISSPPDALVETDRAIVRQLLGLLIDNALRYAGSADVRVSVDAAGWGIEVRDEGPGIPPELRTRIFERFVRGGHEQPGLGLGLFLVRSLAASLGGTVTLDEERATGTSFRVSFPALP